MNHINDYCNPYDQFYSLYYQNQYNNSLAYITILFMFNLLQYFIYIIYFHRYSNLATQTTQLLYNIKRKYNIFNDEDIQMLDIHKLNKAIYKDIAIYQQDWCLSNDII